MVSAMAKVRTEVGLDERHWVTEDGHLHVSVPTEVPAEWKKKYDDDRRGALVYVSGPYQIRRMTYLARWTYAVTRDGIELPLGSLYSRLADAKERAEKNARGEDRMNVA